MRVRTRLRISFLALFVAIICCISDKSFIDPFDSQPRIVVKDGHIIFESARNRNITFKSSGEGSITVNGEDLSRITQLGKTATSEIQRISSLQLSGMSERLAQLDTQYQNLAQNIVEMRLLQATLNDSSSKINQILGTGSNALQPNTVRRAIRKIQRIETSLNRLTQLLEVNECESNPCRNGGTCTDTFNGFICKCLPTWEGVMCQTDVNECVRFIGTELGCQNGATCTNTPGSYSCQCTPNWYGIHCTEQHDDCSSASNEALCSHGTCINQQRSIAGLPNYRCICEQGWTTSGHNPACIVDINECQDTRPHCSVNPPVTCINLPGTFYCGPCPHGYTGNGYHCSDINECEINNGGCSQSPRVQCINTIGSRICGPCPAGYNGNGIVCSFVGTCHVNNGGCHPLAQCFENVAISTGFRECRCPAGYVGSGVGQSGCVAQTGTNCNNNPCVHGSCIPNGDSFSCICNSGFSGSLCELEVNECLSNPCLNGGTCTDQQNGFLCTCTSQWQGSTCNEPREICGGTFQNEMGSISFPSNPNTLYPNRVSCAWVITTTVGKVLNVTFRSFNLESTSDCSYDFLQIHDGPSAGAHNLGRFCGNSLPKGGNIITTHNQIYLWFKSDHSISHEGFQLDWNTTDPVCGGELEVRDYGSVNSPGYPGNYAHNRDCYWLVRVPLGKRIQFHFATLQIETHPNCSYDYLEVIDGQQENDPLLGKFCNTTSPPPLTTSGSYSLLHFHSDDSFTDHGFHITYSAVPGIPGCGGTLTSEKGSFNSPNFPNRYDNNVECDWLIRVHPLERIQIKFTVFDLEHHRRCRWDYLEVRDGDSGVSPLISRFCGQEIPQPIVSTGNKVWVRFRADSSFTGQGFRAEYSTVCGGLYTDLQGVIKSPFFPDPYPSDRKCLYHIVLPQGNLVQLSFNYFDVEGSIDCTYDYLEVRESHENGTELGRFCGAVIPDTMTSRYNELWLKFGTDGSVNNHGFLANYTNIEVGCGGVYTTNHGSIATPNHPNFYPHSATCSWLIRAEVGFVIRLTFTVFALEAHSACNYDYVEVRDSNNATIGKYCGTRLPPVLTSTGNQMFVTFKSDRNRAQEGFAAAYSFMDVTTSCGGNFFTDSGIIRSPGYPTANYPPQRDCTWILEAPNGRQIVLNVTHFELEGGSGCRFDYLEIRNGREERSPLIGQFCGTTIPPLITSHGHVMYLRFKTDRSMSAKGFEITYDSGTTGCGGTLTSQTGSIESPGYPQPYGHNAECVWTISVSQGSSISLTIVDIDIEAHTTCRFDYLEIFDGNSDRSPSLGKYCNNRANPHFIQSKSNVLFLKFRTDTSETGRGFRLNYQINCTRTLSGYRGVIESPNYPNLYNHNSNCSWHIRAPRGNNITIAFTRLLIEEDVNCRYDYLQISNLNPETNNLQQIAQYCGTSNQVPAPFNTTTSDAIVRFVTDSSVAHIGFRLEWVSVGCGGDFVNKNYGSFSSPNYPNAYPHSTECIWHINTFVGSTVHLTLQDFDVEGTEGCIYDYLKVFGGPDETSPLLLNLCHRIQQPKTISSMGQSMTVKFVSDSSIIGRGFNASFTIGGGSCSGSFTTETGTITSPKYPSSYDSSDDCSYSIEVEGLHDIQLTFDDFQMPSSLNCTESYLAIFDGPSQDDPLLIRHCGDSVPARNPIRSTGNKVYMRMKANGNSVGKGFKISYTTMCGGRKVVNSNEIGELTSPNYPHHSTINFDCHWTLIASLPEEHITLTFTRLDIRESETCESNYVEVRDGDSGGGSDQIASPLIGRYCGNRIPAPITSQGNALYIASLLGVFRATYATSTSYCGGEFTSDQGYFMSPNFPNSYPLESECIWIIQASPGNRVTFNFISFNIEESEYCNTDYVELREESSSGPYLGRYCGDRVPTLNFTSTNVLWVKFRSDEQGTAQGFQAYYALQHGIELTGTYGQIASPGYPHDYRPQQAVFTWTISVPTTEFVSITFVELSLYASYADCPSYVQILDGIGETAPEIGRYCGFIPPDPIAGHGNTLTVNFVMDNHMPGKFLLIWAAINQTQAASLNTPEIVDQNSNTSFEVTLNRTGTYRITSPGYPTGYGPNLNYNWTIHTTQSFHFRVNVTNLHMEGNINYTCYYDKLSLLVPENHLSSLWRINKTLCGRFTGSLEMPQSNLLRIHFKTDGSVNASGFDLTVSNLCGGILYDSSGVISTDDVINSIRCEWTIIVREGRTIQINFELLNIPDNNNCQYSYLLLRNGGSRTSPLLGGGRFCGTNIPTVPESSSNRVQITFYAPRNSHVDFRLRYHEVSVGCGDQLTLTESNRSIDIMSPNYPQLPPHDMECDWVIMSPVNTNLRLDFEPQQNPNWRCNKTTEFIEVRDGGTAVSTLIDRYCVPPLNTNSIKTSANYIFIRFVTTNNAENLANFKAKVQINDCGGTYYISYSQELNLPNYPNNYTDNTECSYYLRAYSRSNYFELNITSMDIPANSDCSSGDYIEFREQSVTGELIGRYCGSTVGNDTISFNSKGSIVFVTFKSDTQNTGKGLKLSVRTMWSKCGGTIENAVSTGVITSPNYPNILSESRYCYWYVLAPPGRRIKLTFSEYNLKRDLRNNTKCLDNLTIYKGDYSSSYLRMPCGSVIPDPVQMQSHVTSLYFNTPGLATREGFMIEYSADEEEVCGGSLDGSSGTITSYRFGESNYTETMNCVWDIIVPNNGVNHTVAFTFDIFETPPSSGWCRNGQFKISYYNPRYRYFYSNDNFCGNKTGNGQKFEIFMTKLDAHMPRAFLTTNYSNGYRGISGHYFIQECGGRFVHPDGNFTSPNYPENYPSGSYCSWQFSVDWGEQLRISFSEFVLGDDCEQDYIQVFQGWWSDAPRTEKFCGTQKPPDIQSTSRYLLVHFKGTGVHRTQNQQRFKMYVRKAEHGCGGLLMNKFGTVQSLNYGPNESRKYSSNVECVWNLQMPFGYHINFTFIDRFDIEISNNCDNDFLLFEEQLTTDENSWSQIGKFCGPNRPAPFKSRTNKVRVTFRTNDNINADGFKFEYRIACGEIFTAPTGVFTSPNYPNDYNNDIYCEYLIQRDPRDNILLEFDDDFSIEQHRTCFWDAVDIYLGNSTSATHLGPYCSSNTKPPSALSNTAMLITFRADSYVTAKGFKASYSVTTCGGNYTEPSGEFQSPIQLSTYMPESDCVWLITVQENRVIELKFISIDLQNCWRCNCDYLEIRDGNNRSAPLIGRYCGEKVDSLVKSSGNQLYVRLRVRGGYSSTGFKVGYRTTLGEAQGCGGLFVNTTNGIIQSPDVDNDRKYELDINCWWHLIMPENQVVKITFQRMDIEESPSNMSKCSFDYLEVRDGISHQSPLIDRFCGTTVPSTIIGSSNQLVLQFFSDSREVRTGFKVKFESTDRLCGGVLNTTNVTQSIQSPNYPSTYPALLRCRWFFDLDTRTYSSWYTRIRIKFIDLDVDCNNNDFIEFNAETSSNHIIEPFRMCGRKAPPLIVSRIGLWMTFVTSINPAVNHRGFSLNYTFAACNQTYSDDSGIIVNPSYPDYSYYYFCQMNITAKAGHTISLYFNDFSLPQPSGSGTGCLNGNITVKDGIDTNSPVVGVLCGVAIPQPIFSTGNQLSLELRNSYYSTKFFISYTTTDAGRGCGGNLTSFNGTFTSPLYPMAYNQSGQCKWFIHSFGLHSLTLRFTYFSLSSTIGCDSNYVEIYEGLEELPSNKVTRICGDDNPAPYQSQGNILLVKLVTDANNTAPGFRAQYNFNRREINASKAVITSNLSPHITEDGSIYFPSNGIMFPHNN